MLKELIASQIMNSSIISELEFLRDTGLDMMMTDPDVGGILTNDDKTALITLINQRIDELEAQL